MVPLEAVEHRGMIDNARPQTTKYTRAS